MTAPKTELIVALDVPDTREALKLIDGLDSRVRWVKIGLELFIASGPRSVEVFSEDLATPVVLDLKLYDIPETVERAVKVGGDLGVKYMTLHIQQRETLERAVRAAEPFGITLLGVTVLTSMTSRDIEDLHMRTTVLGESYEQPSIRAEALAKHGYDCGLRGFVCSPQEVLKLRSSFPDAFFLVPGVRPAGAVVGDQKRVGTPGQTVKDGANMIVVGRPIRDAQDPAKVVEDILAEIKHSLM